MYIAKKKKKSPVYNKGFYEKPCTLPPEALISGHSSDAYKYI